MAHSTPPSQINRAFGLAVAVLVAAGGASPLEPPIASAQVGFEQTQLPNGLTVVTVQRPDAETVAPIKQQPVE